MRRIETEFLYLIVMLTVAFNFTSTYANVVGSDAQNFNPTTSGLDFITVQSSATLEPGIYNLGLFSNYAKNPLPYYDVAGAGSAKKSSSLVGGDLNFGLGLTRSWDAGISFPFILHQDLSDDSSLGHYSNTGNTEIRVNTKYQIPTARVTSPGPRFSSFRKLQSHCAQSLRGRKRWSHFQP